MPLLTKKKFKSPLEVNQKIQTILNNAPNVTEILTNDRSSKENKFQGQSKNITSVISEDNIPDLPYSLNAPGVKEAYKKFFERTSQSSGTSSQICSPFLSDLAESNSIAGTPIVSKNKESNSVDFEKFDFMKNFKCAKKRKPKKNYDIKSADFEEEVVAFENEVNESINKKKQRKKDLEKSGKKLKNKEGKSSANISKQEEMSLYDKMMMIQESRNTGLYALCDKCDKARYLPHVVDPLELPNKWYCHMNPDGNHNDCSDPEEILEDEEFLVENLYNAGSIVWARLEGWPWWPAMVEDDPDLEQYFWLEEDFEKPTYYHVTFFDTKKVTRCWLRPKAIAPFKVNMANSLYNCPKFSKFYTRISFAKKQAEDAVKMSLIDRLRKYSFIQRYSKPLKNKNLKKDKSEKENNKRGALPDKKRDKNASINKKILFEQNTQPFTKRQNETKDNLEKKGKKFKRICTISSLEDNSDISIILEDLNGNINLDFMDDL